MNKQDLVNAMAEKTGFTKKDTELSLETFMSVVTSTLASREKVTLKGFGTFEAKQRAERNGVNPKTGESLVISAKTVPTFKASPALKDEVNN
jgi:DNA-binding protein HU-beta